MICAYRCNTPVVWQDKELVDEATGFPHDLTCPKPRAKSTRRITMTVCWCIICNQPERHQKVTDRRHTLFVCLQCGHGEVKSATRRTPSETPAASRR
jgi:hypothetical protein